MAEINIQRKKKPVWPWVILILVILAAAAVWYWNYSSEEQLNTPTQTTGFRQVYAPATTAPTWLSLMERKC
jgi:hypothetical protein